MSFTGKKIVQKIIAILMILILTMVDFAIVGANVVSYAIDMVVTNNENVEFSAYFVNSQDEQVKEIDYAINGGDLKLYVEISVKNEGYFNGQISLEDSSFKFKKDSSNENIKLIEDNKVTLNQINAGKSAKIELGISYNNSEKISPKSLNMDNKINLTGTYKNSKKDIEIKGETAVKINWKSPDDIKSNINASVLTNQNYKINDTNKKVLQVLVNSNLNNNIYPVRNTKIELNIPNGAENVRVHSRSTFATNGNDEFNENNYQYNTETGVLTINIENIEKDGQISWNKDSEDSLVITCVYPENHNLKNNKIIVNSTVTTFDDKQLNENVQIEINNNIDGIVTNKIIEDEDSIYKGKIYTDEQRNYNTSTVLNVDYAEIINEIEISEKTAKFINNEQSQNANIQYVQSKISKSEFIRIFGEDGTLTILDQDGNTISSINKDTESDENGNIIINYTKGITNIIIKTSKPITEGVLEINHTKAIIDNNLSREEVKELKQIQEEVQSKYLKTEGENTNNAIGTIELKDTSSKANIKINKQTLSTITTNENIEIVATLETNDESKDLYKNPKVSIVFPKEIKEVNITQATALYRNGLEKPSSSITRNDDGNIVINLEFKGEQKAYNSEILNGLEIHFFGSIEIDKSIPSKNVELKMNYSNENSDEGTIETKTNLHLESQYGLMLYNKVENYNSNNEKVETIDNNEVEAKLDMQKEEASAKVTTALVNNYNRDLENIEIIGKVPSQDDTNTFNSYINNLKVNNKDVEILYNTNISASSDDKNWTTSNKDAKSYKIVVNKIEAGSTAKITYNVDVEDNLTYNEVGKITTNANYSYGDKNLNKTSNIILATEKATIMEETEGTTSDTESGLTVNVAATSGTRELKENDEIYNGETIKYTVNIANNTDRDLTGINVKVSQTNGKIFDLVETEVENYIYENGKGIEHYWKETDSNIKEFNNIDLPHGETISLEYQAVVEKGEGNETYADILITDTENNINETIKTITNKVEDSQLKLIFTPAVSEECIWYSQTVQQSNLSITNVTNEELKNIETKVILSENLSCDKYKNYINWDSDIQAEIVKKEKNALNQTVLTLRIDSLKPNQTAQIYVKPYISEFDGQSEQVQFYATAMTESSTIYSSNTIVREVQQGAKNIEVTQIAKINDSDINEKTVAQDGDKLDIYITVKNLNEGKSNIYVSDFIPVGLDVNNVILQTKDGKKQDISNSYSEKYLGYDLSLEKGEEVGIIISTVINTNVLSDDIKNITNKVEVNDKSSSETISKTVTINVNVERADNGNLNLTVNQQGSLTDGSKVKDGDKVEFSIKIENTGNFDRTVDIYDYINTSLRNIKVSINDADVTEDFTSGNDLEIEDYTIKSKSITNIGIEGTVDLSDYEEQTISNVATVKSDIADTMSNTITYYTERDNSNNQNNDNSNTNNDNEQNNQNTQNGDNGSTTEVSKYMVSGKAWIDSNENGQKDEGEETVKDMTIRAVNVDTNEVLTDTTMTGEDGGYKIELPEGQYIIIFMYNDEDYYITTYQANGVENNINSDAVSNSLNIDGTDKTVGTTDVINLSSNQENIDIGLIYRNKFDLKLDKYVSRVVVTNDGGTSTYDFDDSDLAKVEIRSKYLSGSTVVVEYKIKITNVGDIEGYVKNIVDYMPSDFKFSSDLNTDWYQSGDNLYNENIANTILGVGESTEVTLILTKTMTETNTGLVNNTAAIQSSYNSKSFSDIDLDNDNGSADLIISVGTGAAVRLALITLSITIVIAGVAYFIMKKYIYKKI